MKVKLLFIVFVMSSIFSFSQENISHERELDSLKTLVDSHKNRDSIRVNLLNQLTRYYTNRDITKNETLLAEAIDISEELRYTQGLADSYTNLTSLYVQSGNYDKALNLALKTKRLQDSIGDLKGLVYTNSSVSRIYNHLGKTEKAIQIQLENLKILKESPNKNVEAQVCFYLGSAYLEEENYNDAEKYYLVAKEIAEQVNFKTGVAIANSSLGVLENKRGNYKSAITYLMNSLDFFKKNNQEANIAHSKIELAVAFAGVGDYNRAISTNNEAIEVYKEQRNLKNLSRIYFEQSDYYKRKKDFLNSNRFLEKHYQIKDSIFTKDKVAVIEEMQTKYETEKTLKEKELAEKQSAILQLESQKNKNLFIGTLVLVSLSLLTALFYFRKLKAKKKAELITIELRETQKRLVIEKQYRDSELKALKAQMNPHFIFNALNSIQDYIILNQKNLASDYLGKFADLIRNYLHFSDTGYISVSDEIHNLNLYLELEKLRFEEQLEYIFQIEESANSEAINIPTMLIQPYVENALKHGLLHKKDNRLLNISISKISNKIIECVIEDNGIGREKSKEINKKREAQHKSFALKATTERLDLLNYGREKKIGVEIVDLKENNEAIGTKVVLQIPILNK